MSDRLPGRAAPTLDERPTRSPGTGTLTLERSFPLVLLVLGVSIVVAIMTNGLQLLALPTAWSDGSRWVVRVVGALAIGAGAYGLVAHRRRLRSEDPHGRDPTLVAVRTAATILVLLTLGALLNAPEPADESGGPGAMPGLVGLPPFGRGGATGETVPATTRGGDSPIRGSDLPGELARLQVPASANDETTPAVLQRVIGLLPWVVFFLLALLVYRSFQRARRSAEKGLEGSPVAAEEAEAGLEASLWEVVADRRDPRGQITNAYHRLLNALAAAGFPREPHEAPHEHLRRTLGPLGVQPEPLHRLAALYVLAQFGRRPVDDEHRRDAASALEISLAGVRAVSPPTDPESA